MTASECLGHLEEIQHKQKTLAQDEAVQFAIVLMKALVVCQFCDGSGIIMVPDLDQESAYECACPNPMHELDKETT